MLAILMGGWMGTFMYIKIFENELQSSLAFYDKTPQDIIFQQDNDLKYTCKKPQNWFQDHYM